MCCGYLMMNSVYSTVFLFLCPHTVSVIVATLKVTLKTLKLNLTDLWPHAAAHTHIHMCMHIPHYAAGHFVSREVV